ncbi:MAG: hypothetical protein FJX74_12920 [Armatimonadetes bacterium]|nr:hypothetical protein [Armatimonadota bacterium]
MDSQCEPFKCCTLCGSRWSGLERFVLDTELKVEGYQANFVDPDYGLFLVTHDIDGCGTTLAVWANDFRHLYTGPVYAERHTGQEHCTGRCLERNLVEACDAPCDMAWVRHVLQWLRRHELPPHLAAAAS